jgi:hypothetical protein
MLQHRPVFLVLQLLPVFCVKGANVFVTTRTIMSPDPSEIDASSAATTAGGEEDNTIKQNHHNVVSIRP